MGYQTQKFSAGRTGLIGYGPILLANGDAGARLPGRPDAGQRGTGAETPGSAGGAKEEGSMIWILIGVAVAFVAMVVLACLMAAGRADEEMERIEFYVRTQPK